MGRIMEKFMNYISADEEMLDLLSIHDYYCDEVENVKIENISETQINEATDLVIDSLDN